MSGIDDLRRTLDQHASGVEDDRLVGRTSAVRGRVAAVRRRRRAAIAGGAAAVLAVVGGVALLPRGPSTPAPATVVGVVAPTELDSLGFIYALADATEGQDGSVRLRLDASAQPRLISWATSGADDEVRIASTWAGSTISYDSPDFGDWISVPAGVAGEVEIVVAEGDPGLAVYSLTDQASDGLTQDGITFRERVADRRLVGAVIGEPGQAEVSVTATSRTDSLDYRLFCSGGPPNAFVYLDTPTGQSSVERGACTGPAPFDAAVGSAFLEAATPGVEQTIRMRVTQGRNGPVIEDGDLRIGLGLYEEPGPDGRAANEAPGVVESDGHRWRLDSVTASDPGAAEVGATGPTGVGPVLVLGRTTGDDRVEHLLDGESRLTQLVAGEGSSTQRVSIRNEPVVLRVPSGREPSAGLVMTVAFYVQAD